MNPQRGAHLGAPSPVPQPGESGANLVKDQTGIGSAQSGYATPDNGPFECSNCIHFDGQGKCDHPQVVSDPEVNGQVDPEGCCNLFHPSGEETQEQEHGETEAIPGAGEQQ